MTAIYVVNLRDGRAARNYARSVRGQGDEASVSGRIVACVRPRKPWGELAPYNAADLQVCRYRELDEYGWDVVSRNELRKAIKEHPYY